MNNLLTVTQTAKLIGVTSRRVLQYIASGRLQATRLGEIWTVSLADAEQFKRRPAGKPRKLDSIDAHSTN